MKLRPYRVFQPLKRLLGYLMLMVLLCPLTHAGNLPGLVPQKTRLGTTPLKKLHRRNESSVQDPITFRLRSNVLHPKVGQEIELELTAHFVNVASGSMFFLPGSNAFSLKVIIPTNFNVTDGSYTDYLQDELSNSRPQVSYTIRGYFTSPVEKACFSVLRGNKEATSTSLFELRHEFYLSATDVDRQGRQAGEATCPGTGSITYERWNDISGTSITDLTGKTNNLQAPASSSQNLTRFEAPTNVADNYGVRMRGYICPPTTGTYYFWIAGDDNVSLRLNGTGNNPAGATQIAYHNGWTDPQMWNRFSEQKSVAINLTAGQQYYVEALMKEGGGGDNLAVGWAKPEEATGQPSEVIPGQYLIPFTTTTTTTAGIVAGKCYSIQDLQSLRYAQRMADNRVMMLDRDVKNDNQLWKVDVTGSQFRFISQGGSATDLLYVDALQNGQSLRVGPSVDNERYRWSMALSNNGGYRIFGGVNQITWDQANAGQNDDLQLFGDNINQADSHWDKPYRRFSFAEAACSSGTVNCNLAAVASPSSVASGATSTLTVSGGGNGASYSWRVGNNQVGTGSSVSVTPTTTTTYQVDCANCGGCIAGQATVTVTNSPPPVSQLTVSPSQVSWATNSNSQYIAVTSNVSWTLSGLPANGWLTASSTNGSGNGSFTLSAQANPMMSSRTATLTVSGGNLTQTITVTQAGATATAGATTCIESESGALTALDIQNNNGASGGRFIGNFGSPASYVVFPVTVPTAGTYTITFAYGAGEAGSFGVSVNGGASQTQTYPATGWTFQTLSFSVALPAGSSTFKVAGQNNAGFWFDKLCISSGGGGSCNLVAAASPGSINSGATSTLTVSGGGNSANYVWKAGGNQIGTGSSVSVTPTTTTTYQVDCANCGGCVAGQATVTVNATNGDQPIYNLATQRRIGMQITEDCSVHTSYGKAYIDAAVAAGIDYVQILVEWSKVRQSDGSLNFSRIDEDVAYALSKGLKLGFRLSLVGDWNVPGRIPWSSSEGHMGDNFGVKHHQNGVAVMSLNHTPTLLEAEIFVRTFATRLNTNTTWRNNILMMSVCQSTILETNYPMDNYDQEQTSTGQHRVEFGWEAASLIKYRDRLKGWFGNSLSAYKTWANSSVTDWSEIMPPTPANASPDEGFGFPFKTQKLWYYHKHLSLREFHEQMLGAIHSINQNWNLTSEISSVNVQINPQMITSGAGLLLPDFVKGMKLNNDYNSNHKLTTELSFRQRLPDQWTMTECGANSQTADQNVQHGRGFFQNDGNVFFIAQPMAAGDNNNDALRNAGITLLGDVITRLKAQFPTLVDVPRTPALNAGSPVEISLYNVCGSNYQQDNVIGGYKAITGNGPKIVYIKDDLLQKTLTP